MNALTATLRLTSRFFGLAALLVLAPACSDDEKSADDAKAGDAPTEAPADDADADEDDTPEPTAEELKKEMEETITADNADEIANALEKELAGELEE